MAVQYRARGEWGGGLDDGEGLVVGFEDLASAGDGVALVVEKTLDAKGDFYLFFPVETLSCAAFVGFQLGELGLPEAEDVGRDLAQSGDVADAEVELVGNGDGLRDNGLADWLMRTHAGQPKV
jgi:hypothetical protein